MSALKILIVEDDRLLHELLKQTLHPITSKVFVAEDGETGLRMFSEFEPDLVILDIMMPYIDGWELCEKIRTKSEVPIIILTSMQREKDVVRGFELGADDFVTKPFSAQILRARIKAIINRTHSDLISDDNAFNQKYEDDNLLIDLDKHLVEVAGERVRLTKTEYRLLSYFVLNRGRTLTFTQILENVWGWEYVSQYDYVHVYVSRLRQKIESDSKAPQYFLSEHGIGYRFM